MDRRGHREVTFFSLFDYYTIFLNEIFQLWSCILMIALNDLNVFLTVITLFYVICAIPWNFINGINEYINELKTFRQGWMHRCRSMIGCVQNGEKRSIAQKRTPRNQPYCTVFGFNNIICNQSCVVITCDTVDNQYVTEWLPSPPYFC